MCSFVLGEKISLKFSISKAAQTATAKAQAATLLQHMETDSLESFLPQYFPL